MKVENDDGYPNLTDCEAKLALWRAEATKYLAAWHPQAKEDKLAQKRNDEIKKKITKEVTRNTLMR